MTVHFYRADDKYTACHVFISYDLSLTRDVKLTDCPHCQDTPVFEDAQAASMEEALQAPANRNGDRLPKAPGSSFFETIYPSDILASMKQSSFKVFDDGVTDATAEIQKLLRG